MRQFADEKGSWFLQFVQELSALAWVKDSEGRYLYVNAAAAQVFGLDEDAIIGRTDNEIFPADTAENFTKNDQLAREQRKRLQTVEVLNDKDGMPRYWLVAKFPLFGPDGTTYIAGTAVDITEQRTGYAHHEFLFNISEMIRVAADADSLMRDAAVALGEFLGVDRCLFKEIDLETDREIARSEFTRTGTSVIDEHWVSTHSPGIIASMRDGKTVVNRDSKADERTAGHFDSVYEPAGDRSYVAVPMMRDLQWVASLWCSSCSPRNWADQDIQLIEGVAERIWAAVERLRTEIRFRDNAGQLRLITDSLPALVSYIGSDRRYKVVNRRYTDWFDGPADAFVGKHMSEVLGDAALNGLEPHIQKVLTGETASFETWLDYKGVGRKYVHASYVPDIGSDGQVQGFYALISDLTEHRHSEELLRMSEDRVRILTDSFTDYAILSIDKDGVIDGWNPGGANIFGYSEAEIIGREIDELFTPEDRDQNVPQQEMQKAVEFGRASDERWHLRKDGSRFYASGVMAPLYIGGELRGFAKIATDLTEKRRQAEDLQRAYEEMELRVHERTKELAGVNESLLEQISERKSAERQRITLLQRIVTTQEDERRRIARDLHDQLGQRLTALRLKLTSLGDLCRSDAQISSRVQRIQQIAALLDSEVSFLAWQLRPTALDELGLVDALETFVSEWSRHYSKSAEFHHTGVSELRLDTEVKTQVYRITQEALNNVVKHADAQYVSVILERMVDSIVLIIEDDGIGFDEGAVAKRSEGPPGLGLAGMKERADLIGGELEIESERGRGTTIYVRAPIN